MSAVKVYAGWEVVSVLQEGVARVMRRVNCVFICAHVCGHRPEH